MDSGAINSVAPPDVSSVPMTESQGSVNGMPYHTADGTRIPNLGQKTFDAVSEQGSALSQTFQIADISRPVTSVGELADAGNVVVFGRDRWTSKENTGCTCFALGSRSGRSWVLVGRSEIDARYWSLRTGNRNELGARKSN